MNDKPFDQFIYDTLEETYQKALLIENECTPEQIRLMIIATSLQSMAKTFLLADSYPSSVKLNLKQVALGCLGTYDWVENSLPTK